ncbi:MAG: carboxypeptidase-like regulatory domain-containing protein [Flammeovirgaceae bacterium]|nr:carboxypeptidase-like regulatory domain-containing protein [Flammeovirgaceae bacterium]
MNIVVKGRVIGTISNTSGEYNLKVSMNPPFTLVYSFIGFATQEIEITNAETKLDISLEEANLAGPGSGGICFACRRKHFAVSCYH